jgi:hypothetical protein
MTHGSDEALEDVMDMLCTRIGDPQRSSRLCSFSIHRRRETTGGGVAFYR